MDRRFGVSLFLLTLIVLATQLGAGGPSGPSEAAITVVKGVNRIEAQVGDVLTYVIFFNNTGGAAAQTVWINDTLPAGTKYEDDNASSSGGVRTGNYNWTFSNVQPGSHFFLLNVTITNEAQPGTLLINLAALNYTNSVGVKQLSSTSTASTLFGIKVKTLHFRNDADGDNVDPMATLPPSEARNCNVVANCDWDGDGFRGITLLNAALNFSDPSTFHEWYQWPPMADWFHLQGIGQVGLWVDNPGSAGLRTINLYFLDWDGTNATFINFVSATRSLDGTAGFEFITVGVPSVDYWVAPGHLLLIILNVDPSNPNPLYFAYESSSFNSYWATRTGTYVDVPYVETQEVGGNATTLFTKGESVRIVGVAWDPLGAFDISTAWVNVTGPSGAQIRFFESMTLLYEDPTGPWKIYDYVFIPSSSTPPQGVYQYEVFAQESNGIITSKNGTFEIRYPVMTFDKVIDDPTPSIGQIFQYTIYLNNSGTAEARILWVNDTLPLSSADYLSDTAASQGGTLVTPYHWEFLNVTPGDHSFTITMRLRTDAQPPNTLVNTVRFNFTDAKYRWDPEVVVQESATITGPHMVLQARMSTLQPREGEEFDFITHFNNTGNEVAPVAWLNYTLSPNLQYKSDTAEVTGLTFIRSQSGDLLQLTFYNVTVGAHELRVRLKFESGLPGGSHGDSTVALHYRASNGAQPPTQQVVLDPHLYEPNITLALTPSQSAADPGDVILLTLSYDNSPIEVSPARDAYFNLTLPIDLIFLNATAGGSFNPGTRVITWFLSTIPANGDGSLRANVSLRVGVSDAQRFTLQAQATFRNDANVPRPPVYAFTNVTSRAPHFSLAVTLDKTSAEYQDSLVYRLYFNQTGSGQAKYTYVNGTLAADTQLVTVTGPGTISFDLANNSFRILVTNAATANYVASVTVRVATAFANNKTVNNSFSLEYADDNGNPLPSLQVNAPLLTLRSPRLEITLLVNQASAAPGDVLRYTITVKNIGSATARDFWINLTLAQYLDYSTDSAPVTPKRSGADYSWRLSDMAPGAQLTFYIEVQVNSSAPPDRIISMFAQVEYTDGRGLAVDQGRSEGRTVKVTAATRSTFEVPWLYLLVALAAAGAAAAVVLARRRGAEIEEIFVVYRDGTLLAHRSKTLTPDKDEDVLTAMFTAVQQFISESFDFGENRDVRGLAIGDHSVEIQRGQYIYIAAIFKGTATPALRSRLAAVVKDIEEAYREPLANWGGNMDAIKGLKDRLKVLLKA